MSADQLGAAIEEGLTVRPIGASRGTRWSIATVRLLVVMAVLLALGSSAQAQTETVEYYGTDAIGSVRVVYDGAGNEVGRADYLPFGEELSPDALELAERFTGQVRDVETGVDYLHARMYQPRTGRFTTTDPIVDGNRYGYAAGNPLRFRDPSGLLKEACTGTGYMDPRTGEMVRHVGCDRIDSGGGGGGYWGSGGEPGSPINPNFPGYGDEPVPQPGPGNTPSPPTPGPGTDLPDPPAPKPPGPKSPPPKPPRLQNQSNPRKRCSGFGGGAGAIAATGILNAAFGVGPALSVSYVPSTREWFVAPGIGISLGHNVSVGPLFGRDASEILPGWSLGSGYNWTVTGGLQWVVNASGSLGGPSLGIPGFGASVTYGLCF